MYYFFTRGGIYNVFFCENTTASENIRDFMNPLDDSEFVNRKVAKKKQIL
jgi:hypothetical protein